MDFAEETSLTRATQRSLSADHGGYRRKKAFRSLTRSDPAPKSERIESLSSALEELTESVIRNDERSRIVRELHDSTSQLLVLLDLQLMRLRRCAGTSGASVDEVLSELGSIIAHLHQEVRALGHSDELDIQSLAQALPAMATEFATKAGFAVHTDIGDLPGDMSSEAARAFFRVAQEALANAARHANAQNVFLSLKSDHRSITLRIEDDGRGFPETVLINCGGCGIRNMASRTREAGGTLTLSNVERGAVLEAKFDLRSQSAAHTRAIAERPTLVAYR